MVTDEGEQGAEPWGGTSPQAVWQHWADASTYQSCDLSWLSLEEMAGDSAFLPAALTSPGQCRATWRLLPQPPGVPKAPTVTGQFPTTLSLGTPGEMGIKPCF
ncbi:hypothetical protein KIL84_005733 [Mauremys mutica]|uniref:Uncharacterized protein n=1 Tax=Mauremys mutica TaxID=74926 RepID=A0A9D4B319_9SAUR|nr:hypothetical protein KIL84_005733 [Mauremys mutica]